MLALPTLKGNTNNPTGALPVGAGEGVRKQFTWGDIAMDRFFTMTAYQSPPFNPENNRKFNEDLFRAHQLHTEAEIIILGQRAGVEGFVGILRNQDLYNTAAVTGSHPRTR